VIIKCDSGTDKKVAVPISASQRTESPEKEKKFKELEEVALRHSMSAKKAEDKLFEANQEIEQLRRSSIKADTSIIKI